MDYHIAPSHASLLEQQSQQQNNSLTSGRNIYISGLTKTTQEGRIQRSKRPEAQIGEGPTKNGEKVAAIGTTSPMTTAGRMLTR